MIITQIIWIAGVAIVSLGILAIGACVRSSQSSRWLHKANQEVLRLRKENARLWIKLGNKSVTETLDEEL